MRVRRDDGTVAVAVLLVRNVSEQDIRRLRADTRAFGEFLATAVEDPRVGAAIACRA